MFIDKKIVIVIIFIALIVIFYLSGLLKFSIVETDSKGNVIDSNDSGSDNNNVSKRFHEMMIEKVSQDEYNRKVDLVKVSLQKQLKQLEDKFYYDNSRFDLVYDNWFDSIIFYYQYNNKDENG